MPLTTCSVLGLYEGNARISSMGERLAHIHIFYISQAVWLHAVPTWSNKRLSADSCDIPAHVYSSHFCDCWTVPLLPTFRGAVRGAGLPSCGSLRPWVGILDQRGRLDWHRALFQTESLQCLSLCGGRGRPLLATDGQILDLILRKDTKIHSRFINTELFQN